MRAMLSLELFNYGAEQWVRLWREIGNMCAPDLGNMTFGRPSRDSWVAEITGYDAKYGLSRIFLHGFKGLYDSNSKMSRGVYERYVLESGHVYEVSRQVSWKRIERYFCEVNLDGDIVKLTKEEVGARLRNKHGNEG